jgi:Tfp pilus assembly protein PilO
MSATETSERRANWKDDLLERLHDPTQLRLFLTVAVVLIGYLAVYRPFDERIAAARRDLAESRKRLALAREVDELRHHFRPIEERLPEQTDSKEWEQYMLTSIRQFPLLKLGSFKPDAPRDLGPYKAMAMQIELSGSFAELDRFLYWLDSNERLFRVDDIDIFSASGNNSDDLHMKITVLGVMG